MQAERSLWVLFCGRREITFPFLELLRKSRAGMLAAKTFPCGNALVPGGRPLIVKDTTTRLICRSLCRQAFGTRDGIVFRVWTRGRVVRILLLTQRLVVRDKCLRAGQLVYDDVR